jgi:hypothetical protein
MANDSIAIQGSEKRRSHTAHMQAAPVTTRRSIKRSNDAMATVSFPADPRLIASESAHQTSIQ